MGFQEDVLGSVRSRGCSDVAPVVVGVLKLRGVVYTRKRVLCGNAALGEIDTEGALLGGAFLWGGSVLRIQGVYKQTPAESGVTPLWCSAPLQVFGRVGSLDHLGDTSPC